MQLVDRLPQSRQLGRFIGKQCEPLREARDAARALGVWDAARAREFAWERTDRAAQLRSAAGLKG